METLNTIQEFIQTPLGIALVTSLGGIIVAKVDPTNKILNIIKKVYGIVGILIAMLETKKKS
ncbi:MAG: hypothetical protein GWP19_00420 [Planctomycetia bacterium]|nr:hypothetical protein [Planctomycetia bacterium]